MGVSFLGMILIAGKFVDLVNFIGTKNRKTEQKWTCTLKISEKMKLS